MSHKKFNSYQIRIMNDIINFKKNKFKNIFIHVDPKNICHIDAMIIGPNNTPYQNGMYFFELKFTSSYPTNPPHVVFKTTDNKVRFNPNLYTNGKVCLSILGTWSGPGWTQTMNLTSILLSIQSLLQENPIVNEPGYENEPINGEKAISYNNYLIYHNFRLAINEVLKNKKFTCWRNKFKDDIANHLKINLSKIKEELQSYQLMLNGITIPKVIYFMEEITLNFKVFSDSILQLT